MKKRTLTNRSKNVLSNVLGRYCQLEISHGKGCYLMTNDGQSYLDFGAGIAVTSTGHCHPNVVKAIQKQAETLIHPCIAVGHYEPPVQLAETLNNLLSPQPYSIFFNQSGSEAVETAIKLARYVTKRKKLIAFEGGFHGRTYGALSLTSSKKKYWEGYGNLLSDIHFFPFPNPYRCPWGKTTPEDSLQASLEALETSDLFDDDVAAIIIEPVLGEGGYSPTPPIFLEKLYKICQQHGILFMPKFVERNCERFEK